MLPYVYVQAQLAVSIVRTWIVVSIKKPSLVRQSSGSGLFFPLGKRTRKMFLLNQVRSVSNLQLISLIWFPLDDAVKKHQVEFVGSSKVCNLLILLYIF